MHHGLQLRPRGGLHGLQGLAGFGIDTAANQLVGGAQVAWAQSITLPWVPGRLRPAAAFVTRVAAPAIGAGYRRVVTKLLDPHR